LCAVWKDFIRKSATPLPLLNFCKGAGRFYS